MTPQFSHYQYNPSLAAAIVAAVLYTLAFIATFVQWLRYRSWVWVVMVTAAAMEAVGYIARCISTQNPDNQSIYILMFVLIVLAPVLMAGACYVLYGRIVYHVVPAPARTTRLLWIPARWLTPIFVICDIIALLLQLSGAVQITSVSPTDPNAKSKEQRGKKIAEIGVAVQLIAFGLFSIIAIRFNFTSKRFKQDFDNRFSDIDDGGRYFSIDDGGQKLRLKRHWQTILRVANIASVCILIRSVYRMVDFSLGRTGYTETHEWCLYVFDTFTIFPLVALFAYFHPGQYLPHLGFRLPKSAR